LVVREAVELLEAMDQPDVARALLDLSWSRAPGDRVLRIARRSRRLSLELHPQTGLPLADGYDPVMRRPRAATMRAEVATLAEAKAHAATLAAARKAMLLRAADEWDARDARLVTTLQMLQVGQPVTDPDAAMTELDLALRHPEVPGWWSDALPEPVEVADQIAAWPPAVVRDAWVVVRP
jgi:hypothetical protein